MSETTTKERPILFKDAMVRAILEGKKTQTRRLAKMEGKLPVFQEGDVNDPANWHFEGCQFYTGEPFTVNELITHPGLQCPYGQPKGAVAMGKGKHAYTQHNEHGDRLFVRESGWRSEGRFFAYDATPGIARCADDPAGTFIQVSPEEAKSWATEEWRRHGWKRTPSIHMPRWASRLLLEIVSVRVERLQSISEADAMAEGVKTTCPCAGGCNQHRDDYAKLWDSINGGKEGADWASNPFVWVVEFRNITPTK